MNILRRLRAMARLGDATLRLAERVTIRRLQVEQEMRLKRLGDITGQTTRAQAYADELEAVTFTHTPAGPTPDAPKGWPFKT